METQEISIFGITVTLGILVLWAGGIAWANKLRGKYLNPYTLQKATRREKKLWAIQLTAIHFGFLGALAVLIPIVVSSPQTELLINVMRWTFCFSGLVIAFVTLAMWEYWKIGNKLLIYQRWNNEKKRDKLTRRWLFSDTGSLNPEVKEFF